MPIESDLARLFYWGGADPDNWVPNEGKVVGSGDFVQWLSSDRLIMVTEAVENGDTISGVAEIVLDSAGDFQSISIHRFENEIWDMRADMDSGQVLLLFFATPASTYPTLGRLDLSAGDAVVDSVILDESWKTWGAAPHPAADVIIVCATKPGDSDDGFYLVDPGASEPSRVQDCFLSKNGARATEVGQDSMLYFVIHYVGNTRTQIIRWDMKDPSSFPLVMAERSGAVDRLALNPQDPEKLLLHRRVYESDGNAVREDVMEVLDTNTFAITRLDVRVSLASCHVVRSGFPDWRADGEAIAFPGGGSTGPNYVSAIWVKGPP